MRGPSGCHGRGDRLPLRARAVAAFGGQAAWQAPPPPTRRPDDVSVGERQGEWRRPVGWGAGAGLPLAAHAACVWTHGPVVACHPGGLADPTDRCRRPRRFDRGRGAVDEAGHDVDDPALLPRGAHHGVAPRRRWAPARCGQAAARAWTRRRAPPPIPVEQGRRRLGQGRAGAERERPLRGCLPLPNPPARVAPRAPAHHPGGHPCGPRPASHPPPGLAVDGRPLLPRRPWGRRLGEERPPRIHWTRVPRPVAEAGRPDVRTRLSPNGPPMMDRGLVDIHPPSRGAATPTVRQRGGPAPRRGGLGAEARRGGTRARGHQRTAGVTVHTRRVPRPAPRLHPRGGRPLSRPPTRRVATGAWPVVHRGRPAAALSGDGDRPDR